MIRKIIFGILLIGLNSLTYSQETSPFPYLDKIEIKHFENRELHLVSAKADIVNRKRIELDKNHKFYAEECEGEYETLIAICNIDKTSKRYVISYGACPNPEFIIYDFENPDKIIGSINADKMFITGGGAIYCSGGEGTFDARKKYTIINSELVETSQPFYYVGLKTKTLIPIKLYETINLENEVASLPIDYSVEVLLSTKAFNSTKGLYLVKTKFGLIGWAELIAGQYSSIDIKDLKYIGD
ncbi:MAG: hypothetical protein COC06_03235 [Bacteroidales bacterium]|nr:MAG: hypothetical protein COC06_03235 [Bacteroidales bacterium]